MKERNKIVVFGICTLVILSTISVAGQNEKKIDAIQGDYSPESSSASCSNATIIYEFHSMGYSQSSRGCALSGIVNKGKDQSIRIEKTLAISEDELTLVLQEIETLWETFRARDNPHAKMSIVKEILQIERDAGFLPASFTLENINETGKMLSNLFQKDSMNDGDIETQDTPVSTTNLIDFGEPFIGFGTALFAIAPYSQVFPLPIGQLGIDVTSNEIPLFDGNTAINFTLTIFAAWMELLIGHAALELLWAISFLPPQSSVWIGPFYSMWGLVGGMSLTIYYKGPPIATLFDICIWGGATSVILPFEVGQLGDFK